jgi:hypothetical protein
MERILLRKLKEPHDNQVTRGKVGWVYNSTTCWVSASLVLSVDLFDYIFS